MDVKTIKQMIENKRDAAEKDCLAARGTGRRDVKLETTLQLYTDLLKSIKEYEADEL